MESKPVHIAGSSWQLLRRWTALLLSGALLSACASGPTNYEGVSGGLRSYAGALRPPEGYKNVTLTRPNDVPTLLEGRQVFAATCAACHGPELRGRGLSGVNILPHPADLRAPRIGNLTDGELLGYIAEGVPGTGMPAWKLLLTRSQMEAVARYVRSRTLIMPKDTRTNPLPGTPPQIVLGRQNYIQTCAVCHGTNARGLSPAGRSLQPRPADLTAPEVQRYSDGQLMWILEHGIVGTPMRGWVTQKVIDRQQAWSILRYLRYLGRNEASPDTLPIFKDGFYSQYPVFQSVNNTTPQSVPSLPDP
ncbi:c-type cytochrome [Deinococcus detaillensis]|uniref:C-type cytochrome n=1 Tax=Deinococcus detaillensis TaxID=2592048 RepID=A0A553UHV9_9DEIO|nr:cytochrome c [Deinococcus detaillensis]TSA79780.1 c-type cytochrome [Deinococcus detaillensis]